MIRLLALVPVLLAVSPLLGLLGLILNPPKDPFGGEPASLWMLVSDGAVFGLLLNSVYVALASAVMSVLCGGWLAWVNYRYQYRGKRLLFLGSLLVFATPSYILAGTLSVQMNTLTFLPDFSGLWASIVCLTIVCIPYAQVIISSALTRLSGSELEAAIQLGASNRDAFTVAIWPQIKESVQLSFFISFLYAIADFGAVATLNAPVLTWRLYESIRNQDLLQASILGVLSLLAVIPVFLLVNRYRSQPNRLSNPRKVKPIPLMGKKRILLYGVYAGLIWLGVVWPTVELSSWVVEGWQRGLSFTSQWDATFGSLVCAAIGAFLTTILVIAPAWLYVQESQFYKNSTFLASALPGILLAFGLMTLTLLITKYTGGYHLILSSGILLFSGYAMRFLSEGFSPIASSMSQINPQLSDIAKILDRYPKPWVQNVLLPHIVPSIVRAYFLVFLACIKELPITLLLGGSTGLTTLTFRTWDRYNEALWHDAGFSGLILLLIAFMMTVVTLHWKADA